MAALATVPALGVMRGMAGSGLDALATMEPIAEIV